jgi:hypothetical protein
MSIYTSIMTITSWCATCRDETTFEHPECVDDHGADCPEWACTRCGEAIMIGFELADPRAVGGQRTSHVA